MNPVLTSAERVTVVIPAAGRVPDGIVALANITCPAMIPVAGRPVVYWTMRYLRDLGLKRFRIAVSARGLFVEDFVDCSFGGSVDVEFVVPSAQTGLGRTVLDLLDGVTTPAALVVLGDTHFELADPALLDSVAPFVLTAPVEESYRWCTIDVDSKGNVARLHDKVAGRPSPSEALVGVYFFPDVARARAAARASVAQSEHERGRSEMAQMLERIRQETSLLAQRAKLWVDVGNADMLATSQRALLAAREFNEIVVDPVMGTLTKRSRHKEKLIDEINYMRLLPTDVAVLFPRLLSFSTDWSAPSVTMEYYGYPTLSEVYIFEGVDPGIWERVFEHLLAIVERGFLAHPHPLPKGALAEMCVTKTRNRLAGLVAPADLVRVTSTREPVIVNGMSLRPLQALWPEIEARVALLEETARGSIIHGDFCFTNILYDLRSRIVKLIDPRGSFGATGIYGDIRYDIAKLFHSVAGFYDFIVNDLFLVDVRGNEVTLDIRVRPQHDEIRRRFEKVFFPRFDRRDTLLLTGLLFASMPPLHADAPRRQLAMFARALQLLNEALA